MEKMKRLQEEQRDKAFTKMRAQMCDVNGNPVPAPEDSKFQKALFDIYRRSDSGLFYGQKEQDFESAIKDIEKIIKKCKTKQTKK